MLGKILKEVFGHEAAYKIMKNTLGKEAAKPLDPLRQHQFDAMTGERLLSGLEEETYRWRGEELPGRPDIMVLDNGNRIIVVEDPKDSYRFLYRRHEDRHGTLIDQDLPTPSKPVADVKPPISGGPG